MCAVDVILSPEKRGVFVKQRGLQSPRPVRNPVNILLRIIFFDMQNIIRIIISVAPVVFQDPETFLFVRTRIFKAGMCSSPVGLPNKLRSIWK